MGRREHRLEACPLGAAADEPAEPPGRRRAQQRVRVNGADELVDRERGVEPLDGPWPERVGADRRLGQPERSGRDDDRARRRHLLHPRGEVGGLADRRVVHAEVVRDRAHDDLAGVEAHPDPDAEPFEPLHLVGPAAHAVLHAQGGVAGADGVVLVGQRRAEERHDPVAHDLVHGALVPVDGLQHALEDRVEQVPRVLGITVGQELHRALEVGEEDGHLLALALERRARREDLLDEVPRRVGAGRLDGRGVEPRAARVAESGAFRVVLAAAGALHGGKLNRS